LAKELDKLDILQYKEPKLSKT